HGVASGTWYFEVGLEALPPSGAVRVGWAAASSELHGPVGQDARGYAYRSLEGHSVHASRRSEYGAAFGLGDVVGCLIHLPALARAAPPAVKLESEPGQGLATEAAGAPEAPESAGCLAKGLVAFTKNGELQGVAYDQLPPGPYFPAVSLYSDTQQPLPVRVRANFGRDPARALPSESAWSAELASRGAPFPPRWLTDGTFGFLGGLVLGPQTLPEEG
ncbi:hypothetical protein H632_c826p0, partial [Helicosporidium sp. ATCC 50920]